MSVDSSVELKLPIVEGFKDGPNTKAIQNLLTSRFLSGPFYDKVDELHQKLKETAYKDIFTPSFEKNPPSQLGEANRHILIFALNHGVTVPSSLWKAEAYTQLPTDQLLTQVFTSQQLQTLQGAFVYNLLELFGQKNMPENNTVAIGGLAYSQSLIDKRAQSVLESFVLRNFGTHNKFQESGLLPGFFKTNIVGSIHVVPFGRTSAFAGKELETMLMLTDDMSTLADLMRAGENISFPRFALNATNEAMANVAKEYLGAQISQVSEPELVTAQMSMSNKSLTTKEVFHVFIPETEIRNATERLRSHQDRLLKVIIKRRHLPDNTTRDDILKRARIEAITQMTQIFPFTKQAAPLS